MPHLTLGQAAKSTGKQKSTILNAINKGRLSASRDDTNQWQIDPSELFRVYQVKPQNEHSETQLEPYETPEQLAQLLEKEKDERDRERRQLQSTIDDLRGRLDNSDQERRQLLAMLTHQPTPEPAPQDQPVSQLWLKLFGKR